MVTFLFLNGITKMFWRNRNFSGDLVKLHKLHGTSSYNIVNMCVQIRQCNAYPSKQCRGYTLYAKQIISVNYFWRIYVVG